MALSIHYVNEVLGQFPSTAVLDEKDWAALSKGLKCSQELPLERLVIGRMTFHRFPGGFQGLKDSMETLQAERDQLLKAVEQLRAECEDMKAQRLERGTYARQPA